MPRPRDDVSSIHRWYSLTLINPASHVHSLALSMALTVILAAVVHTSYVTGAAWHVHALAALAALAATQYADKYVIRNREYSKSLHLSLFGTATWLVAAAAGVAAASVLAAPQASPHYLVIGMFLFAGFRVGIFTSVLGVSLRKAWAACMVQPLLVYVALVPSAMWAPSLLEPVTLGFAAAFMATSTAWSVLTDRAGRPFLHSTHRLMQAYVASLRQDHSEMERLMEDVSDPREVATRQIRLSNDRGTEVRLVLPDIHPGPYHPIGGSNIPYLIYKRLESSAMVMHSISNHTQNLPSRAEVERYLGSLGSGRVERSGAVCTEPVTVTLNKARAVGVMFGDSALLTLSLSPHGMEDLPTAVKTEVERHARELGIARVMIVDSHNAMGDEIAGDDLDDMLGAARSCLESLRSKPSYAMDVGYANSASMRVDAADLGMGGLGVLCLRVNGATHFLAWADANNMENGVREHIVRRFAEAGHCLLEICTSDTHFSRTKVRTKNGYYQFGIISDPDEIASWLLEIARRAEASAGRASYELLEHSVRVRIMGERIFRDYSGALHNALRLTKILAAVGFGVFIASLLAA